jgi:hypothetical protein
MTSLSRRFSAQTLQVIAATNEDPQKPFADFLKEGTSH